MTVRITDHTAPAADSAKNTTAGAGSLDQPDDYSGRSLMVEQSYPGRTDHRFVSVQLAYGSGYLPGFGEHTPVAGLAITPALDPEGFADAWVVTHTRSGTRAVTCYLSLTAAREAVVLLGQFPVDWTRSAEELRNGSATYQAVRATEARFGGPTEVAA